MLLKYTRTSQPDLIWCVFSFTLELIFFAVIKAYIHHFQCKSAIDCYVPPPALHFNRRDIWVHIKAQQDYLMDGFRYYESVVLLSMIPHLLSFERVHEKPPSAVNWYIASKYCCFTAFVHRLTSYLTFDMLR
jgi:hypothetical protein